VTVSEKTDVTDFPHLLSVLGENQCK